MKTDEEMDAEIDASLAKHGLPMDALDEAHPTQGKVCGFCASDTAPILNGPVVSICLPCAQLAVDILEGSTQLVNEVPE